MNQLVPEEAPGSTGKVQRRRDSHIEGLATHGDPESCGQVREGLAEALTGAHAGRVLSREIEFKFQVPSLFLEPKATSAAPRDGEVRRDLARSHDETPCMRGSTLRENRETLYPPAAMVLRAAAGSPRTQSTDERVQGV